MPPSGREHTPSQGSEGLRATGRGQMKRRMTTWGQPIYVTRPPTRAPPRRRRGQHVISKWIVVQDGGRWYTFRFDHLTGWWLRSTRAAGAGPAEVLQESIYPLEYTTMKRRVTALTQSPLPELVRESVVFSDYPRIAEFCNAVMYDDKSARTPGYCTLRNRGASYELTFYDVDAGVRLPVNGATFDEVFQAAERLLATDDAPWQPDKYLMAELERKQPKKKKK